VTGPVIISDTGLVVTGIMSIADLYSTDRLTPLDNKRPVTLCDTTIQNVTVTDPAGLTVTFTGVNDLEVIDSKNQKVFRIKKVSTTDVSITAFERTTPNGGGHQSPNSGLVKAIVVNGQHSLAAQWKIQFTV
jgi:hypothetical protein